MKGLSISLFLVIFTLGSSIDAQAQQDRQSDDYESTSFYDNFWWGANVVLPSFGNGQFVIGVQPMLGYKLDKRGTFSVGPRLSAVYSTTNFRQFDRRVSGLNYGGGLFARAKVYRGYFAHIEYEKLNEKLDFADSFGNPAFDADGEIATERFWTEKYLVGGGLNSGSVEVVILINLKPDDEVQNQSAFEYRIGFTVNF